MKNNLFHELMAYCFDELPSDQRNAVKAAQDQDEVVSYAINGINSLKRKLGNRSAVERYIDQTCREIQRKLFPGD